MSSKGSKGSKSSKGSKGSKSSKLGKIAQMKIKVVNPRYAGAKPEDVARAILRPVSGAALTGSSVAFASRTRRKAIRGGKVAK